MQIGTVAIYYWDEKTLSNVPHIVIDSWRKVLNKE